MEPKCVGEILLAEDNPGDVRLTKEMCERAGLSGTYSVVTDGIEALDFLYQRGDYDAAPRPDIVLLDWHFPKKSGEEVLAQIKDDEDLSHIPVVILTGTNPELEKLRSKDLRAEACVLKPIDPDECLSIAEEFCLDE